jgi:hypothetical protein
VLPRLSPRRSILAGRKFCTRTSEWAINSRVMFAASGRLRSSASERLPRFEETNRPENSRRADRLPAAPGDVTAERLDLDDLGVWVAASPWIVGFAGHLTATWVHLLTGIVVAVVAGVRLWLMHRTPPRVTA